LNGISLTIPPLRERRSEIPHLARMFLARARAEQAAPALTLSESALATLVAYAWPGNVRELKNVIERGSVLCQGERLLPEHLPPKLLASTTPRWSGAEPSRLEAASSAERQSDRPPARPSGPAARQQILDALEHTAGNQTRAAEILGISRRTLVTRLTEFDIPRPRKR
jgi:two-component system response regulator AtoC